MDIKLHKYHKYMDIRLHNSWTVGGSTRQWCPKINGRPSIFVQTFLRNYIDKNESLSLWEWKFGEKNAMYSATIDLVAECQKWLRNVAYVKTDGQTDGQTEIINLIVGLVTRNPPKNITPPPPTTPTFEIQNQNKGIADIMDIDSKLSLSTTGIWRNHLPFNQ